MFCIYKNNTLHFDNGAEITLEPQANGSCFVTLRASNGESVSISQHDCIENAINKIAVITVRFIQSGFVVINAD